MTSVNIVNTKNCTYLGCMVTLVDDDEGKVGNLEVAPGEGVQ